MKRSAGALAAALFATALHAQPTAQIHLTTGALSLDAPSGSVLRRVAPGAWEMHNCDLRLGVAFGPKVADVDDAEPRRCYATETIQLDGTAGVLRTTRPTARIDCPEGYFSLYIPPDGPGASAPFLWAWGGSLAAIRAVIASIHIAR